MAKLVEWSDIDSGFTKFRDGTIKIVRGEESINQSIKLILATMRGERVRLDLGSGLFQMLFEPVDDDTAEDIEDAIETNLGQFEPRVTVQRVRVRPFPEQNYYQISIDYRILSSQEKKNLTTFMPALGAN